MLLENRRVSPKSFAFSSKNSAFFGVFSPFFAHGWEKINSRSSTLFTTRECRQDPPRHNTTSRSASTKRLQKRMECRNFGFNKRKWRSLPLLGNAKQPLPSLFGPCPIALGGERDHVSRNRAMKMGNKKRPIPDKVIDLCASGWA